MTPLWLSVLHPATLPAYSKAQVRPRYIDSMKYILHDADKAVLARPEIREMLINDFAEALRGGANGMAFDLSADHGHPWGFALDQIKVRVLLWHCELDRSVSPAMGKYLAMTIPDCEIMRVPDAGHLWILQHLRRVLTEMT